MVIGGQCNKANSASVASGLARRSSAVSRKGADSLSHSLLCCNRSMAVRCSAAAITATNLGLGHDPNEIIIGNIMLLIPGIALTNSLRDMISGDIISGLLRFLDAILVAVAIAAGYILAARLLGGALWI